MSQCKNVKRNLMNSTDDKIRNLINDGTWNYIYDAEGRLNQATKLGTTSSYSYDHIGRRISKTLNGTKTNYKYDGWNVTREMNESGVIFPSFRLRNI